MTPFRSDVENAQEQVRRLEAAHERLIEDLARLRPAFGTLRRVVGAALVALCVAFAFAIFSEKTQVRAYGTHVCGSGLDRCCPACPGYTAPGHAPH